MPNFKLRLNCSSNFIQYYDENNFNLKDILSQGPWPIFLTFCLKNRNQRGIKHKSIIIAFCLCLIRFTMSLCYGCNEGNSSEQFD